MRRRKKGRGGEGRGGEKGRERDEEEERRGISNFVTTVRKQGTRAIRNQPATNVEQFCVILC